jgi:hypothetical protein
MPDQERSDSEVMLEVVQRYLKAGDFTNIEKGEEVNDETE